MGRALVLTALVAAGCGGESEDESAPDAYVIEESCTFPDFCEPEDSGGQGGTGGMVEAGVGDAGFGGDAGLAEDHGVGDGALSVDLGGTDAAPRSDGAGRPDLGPGVCDRSPGWRAAAPLPEGPRQETAVVALGDEVFVIGGFDAVAQMVPTVEAYDPCADRWRRIADLPAAMHHANAAVVDGRLYVLGFLGNGFVEDGRMFRYDAAGDTWEMLGRMPAPRGSCGTAGIGSRIYLAGGLGGGSALSAFAAYDTAGDSWEALPDLPEVIDHMAVGVIGGVFYIAGGRDGSIEGHRSRVYAFDPAVGAWEARAAMPTSRGGTAAAVLDDRLYVFGGEGNPAEGTRGVYPDSEVYRAAGDAWRPLPAMPTPRHGMGAAAVAGVIVVPGGATVQAFGATDTVEIYVPEHD